LLGAKLRALRQRPDLDARVLEQEAALLDPTEDTFLPRENLGHHGLVREAKVPQDLKRLDEIDVGRRTRGDLLMGCGVKPGAAVDVPVFHVLHRFKSPAHDGPSLSEIGSTFGSSPVKPAEKSRRRASGTFPRW